MMIALRISTENEVMPIPLEEVMASLDPAMRKSVKERSAEIVAEHDEATARRKDASASRATEKRVAKVATSR